MGCNGLSFFNICFKPWVQKLVAPFNRTNMKTSNMNVNMCNELQRSLAGWPHQTRGEALWVDWLNAKLHLSVSVPTTSQCSQCISILGDVPVAKSTNTFTKLILLQHLLSSNFSHEAESFYWSSRYPKVHRNQTLYKYPKLNSIHSFLPHNPS